jgi:hypothetical protein
VSSCSGECASSLRMLRVPPKSRMNHSMSSVPNLASRSLWATTICVIVPSLTHSKSLERPFLLSLRPEQMSLKTLYPGNFSWSADVCL